MALNIEAVLSWLWGNAVTKPSNCLANADHAVDCGLVASVGGTALLTAQSASISATNIPGSASVAAGMYKISWNFRITTAATTSSSLLVTIGYNDGAAETMASSAYTGNSTTAPQSGSVTVYSAAATAITYATTYASSAAAEMKYQLIVGVEQML